MAAVELNVVHAPARKRVGVLLVEGVRADEGFVARVGTDVCIKT